MSDHPKPDPGTCENCGKNPASVRVRRVAAGEEEDVHLCLECARERGVEPLPPAGSSSPDMVALLLKNLSETQGEGGVCGGCGLTYTQFRETGRLGCLRCYEAFSGELLPLLRRVHGEIRHRGKHPGGTGRLSDRAARLRRLNEDLDRAIGAEEYERAAEIRDLIQELESRPSPSRKVSS